MTKDELELALSSGPVTPVLRTNVEGKEIFIADGLLPPEMLHTLRRFDIIVTPKDYPMGCFVTICWCFEGKVGMGWTVVAEYFHDFWKSDEARRKLREDNAIEYVRKQLSYMGKTVH